MVMRRIQSEGLERTLQRLQMLGNMEPALIDHVDLDATFRLAARLDGVPEKVLRPEYSVKRLRRQREQNAAPSEVETEKLHQSASPPVSKLPSFSQI